jgi:hypothetical protein
MAWLSKPLAAAGFLVVAFDHHGNNFVDGYLAEGFAGGSGCSIGVRSTGSPSG